MRLFVFYPVLKCITQTKYKMHYHCIWKIDKRKYRYLWEKKILVLLFLLCQMQHKLFFIFPQHSWTYGLWFLQSFGNIYAYYNFMLVGYVRLCIASFSSDSVWKDKNYNLINFVAKNWLASTWTSNEWLPQPFWRHLTKTESLEASNTGVDWIVDWPEMPTKGLISIVPLVLSKNGLFFEVWKAFFCKVSIFLKCNFAKGSM